MTDIKLLPLPAHFAHQHYNVKKIVRDYAHDNVAHVTEPLQAEIEALRAEAIEWRGLFDMAKARADKAEARAERLAEALREARDYVATALREEWYKFAGHEDCSDIPGIEADLHKIDTALRDHDQEGKDGQN